MASHDGMDPVIREQKASAAEMTAVGGFLFFGATMALLAGFTLLWPGTLLDQAWRLNPDAHRQLVQFAKPAGTLFLGLSAALVTAGLGWFKRRYWAWQLAVVIIAIQVVGDLTNAILGHFVKGGIGAIIAGALLFYLWRRRVRSAFER